MDRNRPQLRLRGAAYETPSDQTRSLDIKAAFAVARKLATVMHAMWRDGTYYIGDHSMSEAEAAGWMKEKLARVNYARS